MTFWSLLHERVVARKISLSQRRKRPKLRLEQLEERTVFAAWIPLSAGSYQPPEIDSDSYGNAPGTSPTLTGSIAIVTQPGPELSSTGPNDLKAMDFSDILQGASETCAPMATMSAIAASPFTIALEVPSGNPPPAGDGLPPPNGPVTGNYRVKLYQKNTQGSYQPVWVTVPFDGTLNAEDAKVADDNEYWTAIALRAYLKLSAEVGANFQNQQNAIGTFTGSTSERFTPNGMPRPDAQRILNALNAGRATTAGTIDIGPRVLDADYGIIHNHAYTVLGIEIPAVGNDIWVTLRNPWGYDNTWESYDDDGNGELGLSEWADWQYGIDGNNDGIIRVPWAKFSQFFETVVSSDKTYSTSINHPQAPNGRPVFQNPNIGPFTVPEGETFGPITVHAVDPEGLTPLYQLAPGSPGYLQIQNGTYTYLPTSEELGTHAVTIQASTSPFDVSSITFFVTVQSNRPQITSLTSTAISVTDAGTDTITLTANGVSHPTDTVDFVEFFRDGNGDGQLTYVDGSSPDIRLFKDETIGDGWSWTGALSGVSPGTYKLFARAGRFSFNDLFYSNIATFDITVTAAPPVVGGPTIPATDTTIYNGGSTRVSWSQVTRDSAGNTSYFYNAGSTTVVRRFNAAGTQLNLTTLSGPTGNASDVHMQPNGEFTVVWDTGGYVYVRRYSTTGTGLFTAVKVSTAASVLYGGAVGSARVSASDAGNFVVTWAEGGYFNEDVYYRRYSSTGSPANNVTKINTTSNNRMVSPNVAADSNGNFTLSWSDGDADAVVAQRFTSGGSKNGSRLTVSAVGNRPGGDIDSVDLIYGADGKLIITWAASWTTSEVWYRRYDGSSGVALDASPVRVNSVQQNDQYYARVAVSPTGHFAIAWASRDQDPGDNFEFGTYTQLYSPAGLALGGNNRVPTTYSNSEVPVGIVFDEDADFTVSWVTITPGAYSLKSKQLSVNLPPDSFTLSSTTVAENSAQATTVGTLSGVDPDGDALAYALVSGIDSTDNNLFTISGSTLQTNAIFNYESLNSYSIRIRATDSSGQFVEKAFSITPTDVNETPTGIVSTGAHLAENLPANSIVQILVAIDPDLTDSFTYAFVSGPGSTDNSLFTLDGDQLKTTTSFDYETKASYSVRVKVTDQEGLTAEEVITIGVDNVNESPALNIANYNPSNVNKPLYKVQRNGTFRFIQSAGTGVTIDDVDDLSAALSVHRMTVSTNANGILTITRTIGLEVTGNGTNRLVLTGSTQNINAALNGLRAKTKPGLVGNLRITFSVNDLGFFGEGEGSLTTTKYINLLFQNTKPTAPFPNTQLRYTLAAGSPKLVVSNPLGLVRGKRDADGDVLTVKLITGPSTAAGTLVLNPNGAFIFRRKGTFVGKVIFTVVYNDGLANSKVATVTILAK